MDILARKYVHKEIIAISASNRDIRKRDVLSEFTSFFLRALAEPTPDRPTVRCISAGEAQQIALDARDVIDDPELRGYSGIALVQFLSSSGILQKLPLELRTKGKALYAVGPQAIESVNPIELLEAFQPDGVICYFSALEYYGLTTQTATHHHVAKVTPSARQIRRSSGKPERIVPQPGKPARSRLGTLIFRHAGVPYYLTNRGSHTISGVQLRRFSEKTIVRITTREQTLLDTLLRPVSCGGASVVWEAWDQGLPDVDDDKLAAHLKDIDDPVLIRRVGYVLAVNEYTSSSQLNKALSRARDEAIRSGNDDFPALFPGFHGDAVDTTWRLILP
jgi:predicted transcriptional regulator of viral defense system